MDRAPLELDENRVDHLLRDHQKRYALRLLYHRDRHVQGDVRQNVRPDWKGDVRQNVRPDWRSAII
jgi:hypothetical protein